MKNKLTLILAIIMAFSMITLLYSCGGNDTDKPNGDTTATQQPEETNAPLKEGLYLQTLGFDNENYEISDFDQEVTEYTVDIPNGNPTIPNIVATAGNGIEVTINQPTFVEEDENYVASVEIKDAEGNTKTYTVTMVQDLSAGFVLKVGDTHKFELGYRQDQDGGVYTFSSSHPEIVSVDEEGVATALKETNEMVTITAKMGEKVSDVFEIDRIEKAN